VQSDARSSETRKDHHRRLSLVHRPGRDTLIASRGLCLATGRLEDARDILLAWAATVSLGMLPNRFPDHGEQPEFNAVDASLWFIIVAHEFFEAGKAVISSSVIIEPVPARSRPATELLITDSLSTELVAVDGLISAFRQKIFAPFNSQGTCTLTRLISTMTNSSVHSSHDHTEEIKAARSPGSLRKTAPRRLFHFPS